jgi:CTP synthase
VPYIKSSGELKTKPTQHSVKELRSIGIQPDILLCRSDREVPPEERRKIALFTNVEAQRRSSTSRTPTPFTGSLLLHAQGVDDIVARKLRSGEFAAARLTDWERVVNAIETATGAVDIAMVGKYVDLAPMPISP